MRIRAQLCISSFSLVSLSSTTSISLILTFKVQSTFLRSLPPILYHFISVITSTFTIATTITFVID